MRAEGVLDCKVLCLVVIISAMLSLSGNCEEMKYSAEERAEAEYWLSKMYVSQNDFSKIIKIMKRKYGTPLQYMSFCQECEYNNVDIYGLGSQTVIGKPLYAKCQIKTPEFPSLTHTIQLREADGAECQLSPHAITLIDITSNTMTSASIIDKLAKRISRDNPPPPIDEQVEYMEYRRAIKRSITRFRGNNVSVYTSAQSMCSGVPIIEKGVISDIVGIQGVSFVIISTANGKIYLVNCSAISFEVINPNQTIVNTQDDSDIQEICSIQYYDPSNSLYQVKDALYLGLLEQWQNEYYSIVIKGQNGIAKQYLVNTGHVIIKKPAPPADNQIPNGGLNDGAKLQAKP